MSGLAPPEVANTRGMTEACFASRMCSWTYIHVPIGLLMATVSGSRGGGVVRGLIRIGDPDIKTLILIAAVHTVYILIYWPY